MSDEDLNIRAAKCLKWKRWEGFKENKPPIYFIPDHHEDLLQHSDDIYHSCGEKSELGVHAENMLFTTSYDWAMLLVDAYLNKIGSYTFIMSIDGMYSPEEISEFCVDRLEAS